MAKKKKTAQSERPEKAPSGGRMKVKSAWLAFAAYTATAMLLTFPLAFKMNSSVYGPYDHASTDMFANIHYYFWAMKYALSELGRITLDTPLFAAPFGSRMNLVNLTGFVQIPVTLVFGHLFSRNFTILFNLVAAAMGMFFLAKHVTKSAAASLLAGMAYAFCPNMLVRSYTTFDSTQVAWIPLYTLFVIRFVEDRTWRNAILAGVFLTLNIVLAMPYYLVFLPVHTVTVLAVMAVWRAVRGGRGFAGLVSDVTSRASLPGWIRIGTVFAVVVAVFLVYYTTVVGGGEYASSVQRTTEQLRELALKPADYLVPHPRSAFLKGDIKESYWNTKRPGKDPDSFVAYLGYAALVLAAIGAYKNRKSRYAWIFIAAGAVAFVSTLGPSLVGIPTPSGIIHSLYASFARRILIYKVFVQMCVAGLMGMGAASVLERGALSRAGNRAAFTAAVAVVMLFEYTIVPPALSVDLSENPTLYDAVRDLPEDAKLIEVPLRRFRGNLYQGYVYYQTHHKKPLFNPYFSLSRVPERIRPFYERMQVPLEAQEYANLSALRWLGISHLTYHWYIGTQTVRFVSFPAPGFLDESVDGVRKVYSCDRSPTEEFAGPYDYTFADLYEITAEPSPVALVFDYTSPFEQAPEMLEGQDVITPFGWGSALIDTTATFYYPVADSSRLVRLLRQGGRISAINLSDDPVDFTVSFTAEASSPRTIEARWNDGPAAASFEVAGDPSRCTVSGLRLDGASTGVLSLWCTGESYPWALDLQGRTANIPVSAVLSDFRVAGE